MNVILEIVAMLLVQAALLPIAKSLAFAWTRLYTMAAPNDERESRREEVFSDLHDQITHARGAGTSEATIAIRMLFRMAWGCKDDVAWFVPYLPAALGCRLERGSDALSRVGTPTHVILSLTVIGFMNLAFFMSEDHLTLTHMLTLNITGVIMSGLIWNQHRPWVRRILYLMVSGVLALALGFMVWTVLDHRLYEVPGFGPMMLALLPFLLASIAGEKTCRTRVFGGRWWPVFVSWGLIATVSFVVAALSGSVEPLLMVMFLIMVIVIGYGIIFMMLTAGAIVATATWHVGVRTSIGAMRLLAVGLQRLQ